jgi:hypothetical protein
MTDQILMHAALYIASSHRMSVGLPEAFTSVLYHKGELMKLISERLAEPKILTDTVISAVMNLAAIQVCHRIFW